MLVLKQQHRAALHSLVARLGGGRCRDKRRVWKEEDDDNEDNGDDEKKKEIKTESNNTIATPAITNTTITINNNK
ncbi:hypothetical protein E2C01_031577 [Portunus trituberculatus]|uniref:Uncharacterized protein n=1 Tax=Portunus trituberculatus TaxID=210409 RepID=A0A5B7EXZ8_PORTR|nr:hypothetical protein [Portunus trituberculatus]